MKKLALLMILLGAVLVPHNAEASSPTVSVVAPRGAQRGRKLEIRVYGQRLKDAQELLFYTAKIKAENVKVINDRQVRVKIHILPDCPLGEHSLRLRTQSGLSELRTFWVGHLPDVAEKEPNNEVHRAQKIPLNVTVQGVIKNEDVDRFKISAKKGQRITVDVRGMRLGTTMFDPAIALIDSRGFILSQSDDTALARQDAFCSTIIPQSGDYTIEVRESAYRGNNNSHYRLSVGTFPRPLALMPPGGKPGEKLRVHFIGDVAGVSSQVITVPKSGAFFPVRMKDKQGMSITTIPFRIVNLKNYLEVKPNGNFSQSKKLKAVAVPGAFNGTIEKQGQSDWIRFKGKKGQRFDFQVFGRRIGSPIDSVLVIRDGRNAKYLTGNDDKGGPDSTFAYTLPHTGEFLLQIRDHLNRGGSDYIYRIEVRAPKAAFTLAVPKFSRYGQTRQDISVPQGNRFATLINASKANFRGPLKIEALGLPAGVKASLPEMHRNVNRIPVVFEVGAKVPLQSQLIHFKGTLNDKRTIEGGHSQSSELVYGPPKNRLYWQRTENKTALAVTKKIPFTIELVVPKIPLVQNGAMRLTVIAHRDKGFVAPIRVEMLINPPGVGSGRSATIQPKSDRTSIPINANSKAQLGRWPIVIVARARVGNGDVWASSKLASIEIVKPFVNLSFKRSAVELGKETEIVCSVKIAKNFEGNAKARLIGLPRGVTAPEIALKVGMNELVFPVKTAKNCRPGRYRNISGQVICPTKTGGVLHRTGRAELRIDRPIVRKKSKPKPKAKPKAKKKKPTAKKRLSRLEQLRKDRKDREAEATKP
ncbi:MAG: peptidase [Planctomycetota bacterium]|nr:peptidase [Planctomycetota bacterium]